LITALKEKLHIKGYHSPHYEVAGKTFYSKHHAIQHCAKTGWEWPTYKVWEMSHDFKRPRQDFDQSVKAQCDLISDTADKVRLWYSGGRDSNLILNRMLKHKSKLDEIAVYRRFPGKVDDESNEWDQFGLLSVTKNLLSAHGRNIPIVYYDILPEHFNYYSSRLDQMYFPYTDIDFFVTGVHTIAEIYPQILDNGFVNVMGHALPMVDGNIFYFTDVCFNLTQNDPYVVNFFCDPRNKELAVNVAYTIRDHKKNTDNQRYWQAAIKDELGFENTGTLLDSKYDALPIKEWSQWHLGRKQLVLMGNAQKSGIGRKTFDNFVKFYFDYQKKHSKYFRNHSIFDGWIGSVSEKHNLLDV
jgi:hypothetical protein